MSAKAATRAGAGLVSVGVPQNLNPIFEVALTEEMSIHLARRGLSLLQCLGEDP
jgi:NAD(P)H-hydrate repair Nnr-like enzyme with NAD(P)H-hydrate dehydratase domain